MAQREGASHAAAPPSPKCCLALGHQVWATSAWRSSQANPVLRQHEAELVVVGESLEHGPGGSARPSTPSGGQPRAVRSRMRSRSNSASAPKRGRRACRRASWYRGLLEAAEPDAAVIQPGDGLDQVAQGAAEPVQLPDHQGVAGPELVQHPRERGPVVEGPAGGLGEHPVAAGGGEGVDLELRLLVGGGDAGIASRCPIAGERRRTL